jgi:transcriptional regulator with XRE-family HTH domain
MRKPETDQFTPFGHLVHELCLTRKISFQRLAHDSGMKSHASLSRACRGETTPQRKNILAWCEVLEATSEQRKFLLHQFRYMAPEEEES